LDIFSRKILKQIKDKDPNWEEHLPEGIAGLIKENEMFGYSKK